MAGNCAAAYLQKVGKRLSADRKKDPGFATLLIIVLIATLSGFGLEVYSKANSENRMARRESQSRQAIYAAEGGVEWAKAQLKVDPLVSGGNIALGEGQVKVSITAAEGGYWVTSEANSGFARRKVKVFLKLDSGDWIVSHYQELHN